MSNMCRAIRRSMLVTQFRGSKHLKAAIDQAREWRKVNRAKSHPLLEFLAGRIIDPDVRKATIETEAATEEEEVCESS